MKLTVKEADFEVSEATTVQLDVCFAFVWSELSQTCSENLLMLVAVNSVGGRGACVLFQPAWQHFRGHRML